MVVSYELSDAEITGFVGGIVLSGSLIPQVTHTLKTRSTKDISYGWQLTYILGLILNYIYFVMIHATAAWVTLNVDLLLAVWLLVLKMRNDGLGVNNDNIESGSITNNLGSSETSKEAVDNLESEESEMDEAWKINLP